jgi:hypothetical protein
MDNIDAAKNKAGKDAAADDLSADLGGPKTKVDASGKPTAEKVAAVQSSEPGHFSVNVDGESLDVNGDEFDND